VEIGDTTAQTSKLYPGREGGNRGRSGDEKERKKAGDGLRATSAQANQKRNDQRGESPTRKQAKHLRMEGT